MTQKIVHFSISATLIGASAAAAIYFWRRQRPSTSNQNQNEIVKGEKDVDDSLISGNLFEISDERVKEVFERVFYEQISLGEKYMTNDETFERGAIHMSNAIVLTGETNRLLSVLQECLPLSKYVRILKYMPTAEIRVNHLLQDELEESTIAKIFE